jgi:tetratricopeptide (TPR) repeat protein
VNRILSDQARRKHIIDETLSISLLKPGNSAGQSTSELDGQFVHAQLSIDVLLRMKSTIVDKNELINLCKEEYKDDEVELAIVNEFDQDYSPDRALWWYTRESFLYRLLNKALRMQNTDMLFLFRFFIRDIERQLEQYKCSSSIRVYRGQLISNDELKVLNNSIGQFISMNSFLSTSVDRKQALVFLDELNVPNNLQRVLFEIDADPRLECVKPFANITSHSYFSEEEEVLMMLGSIFQLVNVRCDDQVWIIRMRLCSDNDNDLKPIFEYIKSHKYGKDNAQTDLLSFGSVLRDMGKFDDAEKYFCRLLSELPNDHEGIADCYHNLGEITMEKGDYDSSLEWHQKSLEIKLRTLKTNDPDLAESYNSIGIVHRRKGDNKLALESFNKALTVFKRGLNEDHPKAAKCFNNIGNVYQIEGKYLDALEYYQKAFVIQQRCLPADHPDLGTSHGNIGSVHQCLDHYDLALEHYNMSLEILRKTLPPQHPSIAITLKNIGVTHENKREPRQALKYFEEAAAIRRHAFPATHPSVLLIEQDIRRVTAQLKP